VSSNTISTSRTDSPIFSSHIVSSEKVGESNYFTCTSKIWLWLSGLSYKSHLTVTSESVPPKLHEQWIKIPCGRVQVESAPKVILERREDANWHQFSTIFKSIEMDGLHINL